MSYLVEQESICTHCQFPNQAEVWSAINVKLDPELRDLLLGGEINLIECSACKKVFYAEHFMLYHDPAYELMAFVYPQSYESDRPQWEEKTAKDFAETQANMNPADRQNYAPVTVFGMDDLVILVEDEEELSIQGEIISLYSKNHGFKVKSLSPAQARALKIPTIIPYIDSGSGVTRDSVLAALTKIKSINDRLFVYTKFEEIVKENPKWALNV